MTEFLEEGDLTKIFVLSARSFLSLFAVTCLHSLIHLIDCALCPPNTDSNFLDTGQEDGKQGTARQGSALRMFL